MSIINCVRVDEGLRCQSPTAQLVSLCEARGLAQNGPRRPQLFKTKINIYGWESGIHSLTRAAGYSHLRHECVPLRVPGYVVVSAALSRSPPLFGSFEVYANDLLPPPLPLLQLPPPPPQCLTLFDISIKVDGNCDHYLSRVTIFSSNLIGVESKLICFSIVLVPHLIVFYHK